MSDFLAAYGRPISGLLALFAAFMLDVFTWQGFAVAFLFADPAGLWWAFGTRLAWWFLAYLAGIGVVMRLLWREARLECPTMRDLFLAAHVSLAQRAWRRLVWRLQGIKVAWKQHRAHRPRPVVQPVSSVSSPVQRASTSDVQAA